jgi:hypothetical protein
MKHLRRLVETLNRRTWNVEEKAEVDQIKKSEEDAVPPPPTGFDFLSAFPLFTPRSWGADDALTQLTILAIQQTIDNLGDLVDQVTTDHAQVIRLSERVLDDEQKAASATLKDLFNKYASDKSTTHDYELLYGPLLVRGVKRGILEIGLGTNNLDVVSSMGLEGRPGGSLRAFRDFTGMPVFGADIDRRILFREELIETFYVDQTEKRSFDKLRSNTPADLDLVIDDGLHAPNANLATLAFGLEKIREGGAVVIEDIGKRTLPLWKAVKAVLPNNYRSQLFQSKAGNLIFVVEQLVARSSSQSSAVSSQLPS